MKSGPPARPPCPVDGRCRRRRRSPGWSWTGTERPARRIYPSPTPGPPPRRREGSWRWPWPCLGSSEPRWPRRLRRWECCGWHRSPDRKGPYPCLLLHGNVAYGNAQLLGDDLGVGGLVSLSLGAGAEPGDGLAGRVYSNIGAVEHLDAQDVEVTGRPGPHDLGEADMPMPISSPWSRFSACSRRRSA